MGACYTVYTYTAGYKAIDHWKDSCLHFDLSSSDSQRFSPQHNRIGEPRSQRNRLNIKVTRQHQQCFYTNRWTNLVNVPIGAIEETSESPDQYCASARAAMICDIKATLRLFCCPDVHPYMNTVRSHSSGASHPSLFYLTQQETATNVMNTLTRPLTVLASLSFLTSTVVLVLGALVLPITPAMWIIPGAFVANTVCLSLVTFITQDPGRTTRFYSIFTVGGAFALTVVWTAVLAIALTFTTLITMRSFDVPQGVVPYHKPILISACATALLQTAIKVAFAILLYKEQRRAKYQAKWRWNITLNASKWSITKAEPI
ncbi:hypothetical protein FA15DRAFT_674554 [Coprinopsis marcescibilis]|uniref:Uncharacterized protein n=1 Tax=Coprinopsis marcescibilis TaxID=230819 RepID=A0A5C3KHS8_COPMA|nr:hypothetical protein FA15DRAFT_674554 [Coprinopsis marcescibilis]